MKTAKTALIAFVFSVSAAPAARAHDLEIGAARYADQRLSSLVSSVATGGETRALFDGEGRATSARLGYTGKRISFREKPDLLDKQLGGKSDIVEHSLSASVEQGLAVGTTVGVMGGGTKSPLTRSRFFGARAGQWWRSETLQTNLELRRTSVSQPPIEFTDTDGKRIETPADLDGLNASLTVTHLTTPTTVLRGGVSRTERSDRPAAGSVSFEGRQFITAVSAAVHAAVTHYENVGRVDDTQIFGSIVANSAKLEWHQRLPGDLIAMGGYRYYLEQETPRAADAARKQLGSDDIYASLRWRFGPGGWTDDRSEAYLFAARYTTNAPTTGHLIGLGVRLVPGS